MLKNLILAIAGCAVIGIAGCDAPSDDTSDSTVVENCSNYSNAQDPQDRIAAEQCLIRAAQEGLNDPEEGSSERQADESTLTEERAQLAIDEQKASAVVAEPAPAAEPAVAQTIDVNGFTATPPEPPSGNDAKVKKIRDCFYSHISDLNKSIQNDKLQPDPETVAINIKQDYAETTDGINNCIGGDAYHLRFNDTSVGTYYDPNWVPGPTHDYYGNLNLYQKTDANGKPMYDPNGSPIMVDSLGNPYAPN